MVKEVSGNERFLPLRLNSNADVARGMAQRGHQAHLRADLVSRLHKVHQAGVYHRGHGIEENLVRGYVVLMTFPILKFTFGHKVARVREGGLPS